MSTIPFTDTETFKWVILPILIFLARMSDVTLGTLRNVFISKGLRRIVPIVGFFEVLIWLISIRQIMQHLDNPLCYLGFAGGFSMGTYVGLLIEKRLALGTQVIRIITSENSLELTQELNKAGFGITVMDGTGSKGPVKIIFTLLKRKDIDVAREVIHRVQPNAFYSIEDVRVANQGVFPRKGSIGSKLNYIRSIFPDFKTK